MPAAEDTEICRWRETAVAEAVRWEENLLVLLFSDEETAEGLEDVSPLGGVTVDPLDKSRACRVLSKLSQGQGIRRDGHLPQKVDCHP